MPENERPVAPEQAPIDSDEQRKQAARSWLAEYIRRVQQTAAQTQPKKED